MDENPTAERAAVEMLLAMAQQAAAPETPASEEPVGDVDDLTALFAKQKELVNQQAALKKQEADLLASLQNIRDQSAGLEQQVDFVKAKAAKLFETVFGKERPAPQIEQPQPTSSVRSVEPPRKKLDNSVVIDRSVPGTALPPDAPPEAKHIPPSFNF